MTAADATRTFEAERPRLLSLAYRMLGELQLAEDVVQEAWLRWHGADAAAVRSPAAWLTTAVTRLAIDQLRAARTRREAYPGPWLPEPVLGDGPAGALELARECELALLWSLERLDAEERAAFLLHRVFEVPSAEVAAVLGRSDASCRQLISRAARRLAEHAPRFDPDDAALEQALLDFAAAAAAGSREEVMRLLSPDVVALSDGGGLVPAARIPLVGPERVARVYAHVGAGAVGFERVTVNGRPALLRLAGDARDTLTTLRLDEAGQICWIYTLRNPQKLAAAGARASGPWT